MEGHSLPTEPPGAEPPAEHLDQAGYRRPFRRYQGLALEAFEHARGQGRRRCYLVMPPGAGKTVVGLEIARRLARKTIVFGPNTAIQAQWIAQSADFIPPMVAGTSPQLVNPVTVLTYQALCSFDADPDQLDELPAGEPAADPDEAGAGGRRRSNASIGQEDGSLDRRRRRQLVLKGGDRADILGLLHPNGRELFARIKSSGDVTLVLDECHHLLETWGHLVEALVDELGEHAVVVGLTATPPGDMEAREAQLYERLFGRADFEVPTPAVVKEGDLAPYQELAYLTEPLPLERDYIAGQERRFQDLIMNLLDPTVTTRPFLDWLSARVIERRAPSGAQVSWGRFELENPDLAVATIRVLLARRLPLPEGARVRERHRQAPTAGDWAALIEDFCQGYLRHSADPGDLRALESIRRSLPSIGYILTRNGVRAYASPVDRVLALSAAKAAAAQTILDLEQQVLGAELRSLILCDFERAGIELMAELRDVLDPQAGSASLVIQLLLSDAATRALNPILMTGRSVACARSTAVAFADWCGREAPDLQASLAALAMPPVEPDPASRQPASASGWDQIVQVQPVDPSWQPRRYVPLVTRFFEEGRSRCLVGTRGLLGEGWDARSVNVLIDLTAASTSTSVHQMRGRSLRLDDRLPRKVADNWDVVCLAPEHPKGDTDYRRFVRKHQAYFALTAAGEIECGVSHVDPILSPFGPPMPSQVAELNARTLERIGLRGMAYEQWQIGRPYRNVETETVRLRFGRPIGLPGRRLLRAGSEGRGGGRLALPAVLAGVVVALGGSVASIEPGVSLGAGALIAAAGAGSLAMSGARAVRALDPSTSLEDLASAVIDALGATGGISPDIGVDSLRLVAQPDGYYRCYLEGATTPDSRTFADALDDLLAPLDSPRYLISRRVLDPPRSTAGALRIVITRRLFGVRGRLVWHAVPGVLAADRERVAAFERSWNRWVGPGRALFHREPLARGILELEHGENPFAAETQLRTLWS